MPSKIGFIGLGIMGKGMLLNLAAKMKADFVVWNRSSAAVEEVAQVQTNQEIPPSQYAPPMPQPQSADTACRDCRQIAALLCEPG